MHEKANVSTDQCTCIKKNGQCLDIDMTEMAVASANNLASLVRMSFKQKKAIGYSLISSLSKLNNKRMHTYCNIL